MKHMIVSAALALGLAALLAQAAAQTHVLDAETHRAPIDEVIADIYRRWQGERVIGVQSLP
ncbi:hypothetical protein SE17_03635 [Kouleothrix aurantiaca]|uniref:Uncharacterized protein n=1 Tax=Kouleothrix aurantiaca TaxID=186479 RepID=A0A0P9DWR0_9CHLR|nr:hypothetical protein SE17_03635 [Kouleothrix aurantiaca]